MNSVSALPSAQVTQSRSFRLRPLRWITIALVVLVAEETNNFDPVWLEGQEDQAARSTTSALTLLPGGHFLMYGNADALAAAVREVLQLTGR